MVHCMVCYLKVSTHSAGIQCLLNEVNASADASLECIEQARYKSGTNTPRCI